VSGFEAGYLDWLHWLQLLWFKPVYANIEL